jgi:hypothetical protein
VELIQRVQNVFYPRLSDLSEKDRSAGNDVPALRRLCSITAR